MTTYIMLGKYTAAGIGGATPQRTKEITDLISRCGGKVEAMFAVLPVEKGAFAVERLLKNRIARMWQDLVHSSTEHHVAGEAQPDAVFAMRVGRRPHGGPLS